MIPQCRVAVAASDPVVAITSIMSASEEIFASDTDSSKQSPGAGQVQNSLESFGDEAEEMPEVEGPVTSEGGPDLNALKGKKVWHTNQSSLQNARLST